MEFRDYYQTLGVARDATPDDVRRAYRKLARKFHPDVSTAPDADTRFKEIGEAYAVLKDPDKRVAYDRAAERWRAGAAFGPPPRASGPEFTDPSADIGADDFSDFFDALFGRGKHRRHPAGATASLRGQDHHARVSVELEDAYRGANRRIALSSPVIDDEGRVTLEERWLDVAIPKGVQAGQQLRLAGQGSPGLGDGAPGDLYLEIAFKPHPRFRVDGRDVFVDLPLAPWEAALGASVEAPTPEGPVELTVPPNSAHGRRLRLKARGIPGPTPGDLYVGLSIVLPPADTDAARDAYRAFARAFRFDPRHGS